MATETAPLTQPETAEAAVENRSILDRIAEDGRIGQSAEERKSGKLWLKDLVQEVMTGQMTVSKDTEVMINSRIGELDALISRQLNEVMHAEPFQKLEGSWRGLHYFVQQTETSSSLKIKLMNISKTDLLKDFNKATEFDQSAIFKKVYEEEYGTLGGNPFGTVSGGCSLAGWKFLNQNGATWTPLADPIGGVESGNCVAQLTDAASSKVAQQASRPIELAPGFYSMRCNVASNAASSVANKLAPSLAPSDFAPVTSASGIT